MNEHDEADIKPPMKSVRVLLTGRPNVGKSTLFNRLIKKRKAIVSRVPGTTRDYREGECLWRDVVYHVIDTGGLFGEETWWFEDGVQNILETLLHEVDLVLFLVDGRKGLTYADEELYEWLTERHPRVWVLVNKVDTPKHMDRVYEFYKLGAEQTIGISAESGFQVGELLDRIFEHARGWYPEEAEESEQEREYMPRILISGRPNAGKSSLLNRILGFSRVLVTDIPGTTRDVVDTEVTIGDKKFVVMDSAGYKKRGKIREHPEAIAMIQLQKAFRRSDMIWLVLDATRPIARKDKYLAGWSKNERKALLILLNKWDIVPESVRDEILIDTRETFRFVSYAPILPISAKEGTGIDVLLEKTKSILQSYEERIPTSVLNTWLDEKIERVIGWSKGRPIKIKYMTQIGVRPPLFVLSTSRKGRTETSWLHVFEKQFRETFPFEGIPLTFQLMYERKEV